MSHESEIVYKLKNISEYTLDIIKDTLIIKKDILKINDKNINTINFIGSTILNCKINNDLFKKLKYKSIILELWYYLKKKNIDFKQFTQMNYKEGMYKINGYNYNKDLNISIQNKHANGSFLEIYNLVNKYNISFYIKIQLKDKKIIYFENLNN